MAALSRGRSPKHWLERRRERRLADQWIRHGFGSRYAWRVAELTADRERRLLARDLRGVVAEVRGSSLPGATPLRSAALRPHVELIEAIVERLAALDRPVAALGVLGVQELLTSPGSIFYAPGGDVAGTLACALQRLETT